METEVGRTGPLAGREEPTPQGVVVAGLEANSVPGPRVTDHLGK